MIERFAKDGGLQSDFMTIAFCLHVTSFSSRRHLENSLRQLTNTLLTENRGLIHLGLFRQREVTLVGNSCTSYSLLPPPAARLGQVCPVLCAPVLRGNDSSFGSSFLGLRSSSQPEDVVIWSLFLGAWSEENAEGPREKGAVFGPVGPAGGWEAVSACPQGYNGHTQ